MSYKKEGLATLGLIFITFLAAIQYIFLQNVPDDVSTFAFVCITNLIGLIILGLVQIKKVVNIKGRTLAKGIIFAVELTGFNYFVLLGSKNLDVVVVSSVVSLYFIFITPLLLLLRKKVSFFSAIASVIAVIALLLMFGADTDALFSSREVVYLIIADMFFAAYVVSVSILGENEESSQLTFAQMLFSAIFALAGGSDELFNPKADQFLGKRTVYGNLYPCGLWPFTDQMSEIRLSLKGIPDLFSRDHHHPGH